MEAGGGTSDLVSPYCLRYASPATPQSAHHCEDAWGCSEGVGIYSVPIRSMFDPMSDLTRPTPPADPTAPAYGGGSSGGTREYGKELHSITIHAKQRTFYVDLKESSNGKFFKISEKSRGGRKTTIMFDAEDLDSFINALSEMKAKL